MASYMAKGATFKIFIMQDSFFNGTFSDIKLIKGILCLKEK